MTSPSHAPRTPDYAETHPTAFGIGKEAGRNAVLANESISPADIVPFGSKAGDEAVMTLVGGDGETTAYDGQYIAAAVHGARAGVMEAFEERGEAV